MPTDPDRTRGGRTAHPSPPIRTTADQRLGDALRAAPSPYHAAHPAAMRDLEAAVCAVVDELRARGLGPEKVLAVVKAHVAAQAAHRHDLLDGVVRWCIVRYYDRPAVGDAGKHDPATEADDHGF